MPITVTIKGDIATVTATTPHLLNNFMHPLDDLSYHDHFPFATRNTETFTRNGESWVQTIQVNLEKDDERHGLTDFAESMQQTLIESASKEAYADLESEIAKHGSPRSTGSPTRRPQVNQAAHDEELRSKYILRNRDALNAQKAQETKRVDLAIKAQAEKSALKAQRFPKAQASEGAAASATLTSLDVEIQAAKANVTSANSTATTTPLMPSGRKRAPMDPAKKQEGAESKSKQAQEKDPQTQKASEGAAASAPRTSLDAEIQAAKANVTSANSTATTNPLMSSRRKKAPMPAKKQEGAESESKQQVQEKDPHLLEQSFGKK